MHPRNVEGWIITLEELLKQNQEKQKCNNPSILK